MDSKKSGQEKLRVLIVDDSQDTVELIRRNLENRFLVRSADSVARAVEVLEADHMDLVITDMKMPQQTGFDLIRHIHENEKETEVIMVTGYPSIEGAVKAVKLGAEQYLAKPFTRDELMKAVETALHTLHGRKARNVNDGPPETNPGDLIGSSDVMKTVYETIMKASRVAATLLITGESGTGKELTARAVHYNSPRANAPFVAINCSAIPEQLLESEFFGYIKGAFTGANETRAGFFQIADGGTIFLDEISEMPNYLQAKILRVLQDKEIIPVGGRRPVPVDVRIIAATNKKLEQLVARNIFREDLFYRLNVLTVELPPLRERGNDVFQLAAFFLERYAELNGLEVPVITEDAMRVLRNYSWPGNVRELENLVQRFIVLSEGGVIDVPDLPQMMRYSAMSGNRSFTRTLAEVESEYIHDVLESVDGNKTRAAEILGIDRKTLRQKLPDRENNIP